MWDVTARGSLLPNSEAAYLGTLPAYSLPRVNNAGEMRYFLVHRWVSNLSSTNPCFVDY